MTKQSKASPSPPKVDAAPQTTQKLVDSTQIRYPNGKKHKSK